VRYSELGNLITQMIKTLNARTGKSMAGTMNNLADQLGFRADTIYNGQTMKGQHIISTLQKP